MTDVAAAVAAGDLSFLDDTALHDWVVAQRWFASKAREVAQIEFVTAAALRGEPPLLVLALVEARFPRIGELPYLLTLAPRGFYWFQLVEGEDD